MNTTKEQFLKAVGSHEMTVSIDTGLHRHITFKNPKTFNQHFHLTTWPGYLAFSGDMGSFVFARLPDMFQFFRGDEINTDYWSEKLQAHDRHGGHEEFSEERFVEVVKEDFEGWEFESDEQKAEAWAEVDHSLIDCFEPDAAAMIGKAMDYRCPTTSQGFNDFWDHSFREYTPRFVWCCYAIQWGIQQYDASRTKPAAAPHPLAVKLGLGREA